MQSGDFDRQIDIQQPVYTRDPDGGKHTSFVSFLKTWAKAKPMSSKERFVAFQVREIQVYTFTIRYLEGILPTFRINYQGGNYRITGINEVGRRKYLEIQGEWIQGAGLGN